MSSLPVPVSPSSNTEALLEAAFLVSRKTSNMADDWPMMFSMAISEVADELRFSLDVMILISLNELESISTIFGRFRKTQNRVKAKFQVASCLPTVKIQRNDPELCTNKFLVSPMFRPTGLARY